MHIKNVSNHIKTIETGKINFNNLFRPKFLKYYLNI